MKTLLYFDLGDLIFWQIEIPLIASPMLYTLI